MIFNLFGKKNKEKAAQQKATARQKTIKIFEDRKRQSDAFRKERIFDKFEWHYVDETQPLNYPTKRTFEVLADTKVIESDFFLLKEKRFVCFCDKTSNKEFENYIAGKTENITTLLSNKGWKFIHIPSKITDVELLNLSYYFPFANWDEPVMSELKNIVVKETIGNQVLEFYKYDASAKTGFILINGNAFVFIAKKEDESMADFVQAFLAYMPNWKPKQFYASPPDYDYELDKETAIIIKDIKLNLDRLKENGQFFAIAPTIYKIIEDTAKATPKISRMLIDVDYRILLPDYQNREIKLSHLTKSLYFLFLKHPRGVYFVDFKIYENELFEIYKKISNRVDLEKMRESISELSNADEKNMRIHISRIKSAFAKEFSDFYASKYYVIGREVRIVLLDRQLLGWDAEV